MDRRGGGRRPEVVKGGGTVHPSHGPKTFPGCQVGITGDKVTQNPFVISTGNNHQHIFKTLPPFYPTVPPQGHLLSLVTSVLCSLPQWSGVYSRWGHKEPFPGGSLSLVLLTLPHSALPLPKPQASSSELSVLPRTTVLKGTSRGPSGVDRHGLSPCL